MGMILIAGFVVYIFYLGATNGCDAAHHPIQQGMSCGFAAGRKPHPLSAGILQSDYFAYFMALVLVAGILLAGRKFFRRRSRRKE